MDLTFINGSSEFRADSHFNLHLEGAGKVSLYRRTSGVKWDFVAELNGDVVDIDVPVSIPKDYRVIITDEPNSAVMTINGGGVFPELYEVFSALDGAFLTADGKQIKVLINS